MDSTYINIFNGVTDQNTSNKISVLDVIGGISWGRWKDSIESYRGESNQKKREQLKKSLPAVTFAGTLNGKSRLDENLDNYTGIVVCDVDKISQQKLTTYKNKLVNDGYVLCFFESPSKGIKILVRVDSDLKYHKSHAFKQIEEYFLKHYDISIDPSGKNPSRLCFISFDEDLHYNEDADVFPVDVSIDYDAEDVEATMKSIKHLRENVELSNDASYIFELLVGWVRDSKTGGYHKGNRNNFVFHLACLMNEAGVHTELSIMLIFERYSSLGLKEIKTTVNSAYKHNSGAFGTKPIYKKKSNQQNFEL